MVLKSGFDKFYLFGCKMYDGPMTVAPINNDTIATPDRKKLFCGDFLNIKPVQFTEVSKGELCDLIVAGAPSFYLISDRITTALSENSITGWGSYPVSIITKSKEEITNYHALYITGKADKADRGLAEKVEVTLPSKMKKLKDKGYYFSIDSWEGTDFFYHIGSLGAITVTERVKLLFESINATNAEFRKCSEFIWP